MAEYGSEKLKIKTVSGADGEEAFVFSPEEMLPTEVAEALDSDLIEGKTPKQVKRARRAFGINEIRGEFRLSFRESLKNQFKGLTALFLLISSIIMYLFNPDEPTYIVMAVVVSLIMVFNAFAEHRASVALRLPKEYSSLKVKVVRNGEEALLDSRQLVPGDIIIIETGTMIPADCRIIDDFNLSVLETHVSGEKGSAQKDGRYVSYDGPEAISPNMVYAGSIVTSGHGTAIVCRTGKETLLRRMRSGKDEYTPKLIRYVIRLCNILSIVSVVVCFALLFIGIIAGADITEWFMCALAIGMSSLCDSMVSLAASSLGFGAKRMTQDGMVIKNYDCIQTLASADTIMCGKNLAFPPKRISLSGIYISGKSYDREKRPNESVEELLRLMLICSDARKITAAEKKQRRGLPEYEGSPIENAIVDYFDEWMKPIGPIREQYIRMDAEYTLSGDISRLLALHNGKNTVIVRGSPENILSRCAGYTLDGTDYKLSDFTRKKILTAVEEASKSGSILIAVACGTTESETLRDIDSEDRLIFKGFVSMSSSLDPGIAEAVYRCENAGIETVLNSNDAYYSAFNSAKSAGIITEETQIITAEQIRSCDRGLFIANSPYYRLFLNIDDGEWLDIIKLRREDKKVTVVTAERINELPIMNEADVSIVPQDTCDTLRQTADAMLLGSGINLISDGILNAKTICRRISSAVKFLPVAMITMFVASVFSVCYNQTPALRPQDVLFGGIIFNLAFAVALAFEPRNVKNLRDRFSGFGAQLSINDFIHPLMFSVGAGIILFMCSALTGNYACALMSLSIMLFLYACSVGGHGGIFATKRFGNRSLLLCGFGAFLVIALLIFTPIGRANFSYGIPNITKFILTVTLSVGYCVLTQVFRYFITRGKPQKTENDDISESESDEFEEFEEDFGTDNTKKEKEIYDFDERSEDEDEDNC